MIKMMIVDDEMLVRIGMKAVIPWEDYGIEITAEASNGREALERCGREPVDLMLVDIVMPEMDGLALIGEIKKRHPATECVILTCMDELHYVKDAMALGAAGYFTKISIDREQMLELILQLKEKIESRKKQDREIEALRQYLVKNKWLLNRQVLQDIFLAQKAGDPDWERSLPELLRPILSAKVLVVVRFRKHAKNMESERVIRESMFHMLENAAMRHMTDCAIFPHKESEYLIVGNWADETGSYTGLSREIRESLHTYFNIDQVDVAMTPLASLDNLHDAYEGIIGETAGRELALLDGGNGKTGFDLAVEQWEDQFLDALKEGSGTDASQVLQRMMDLALAANVDLERLRKLSLQMMFHLEKEIRKYGESIDQLFPDDRISRLIRCESKDAVSSLLLDSASQVVERLLVLQESRYRSEIAKAIEFIHLHYREKLTLDYVASLVNMNSAYFSRLFKKEVGMGFAQYLTEYRIGIACELLRGKELRVAEVAEQTGYEDDNYFSKVFKRVTGCSPTQYRTMNNGGP